MSSPPLASPSSDNDGTLWTEKPLVIQLDFTIRRFRELAESDPSLRMSHIGFRCVVR